jgi:hypothetical protein
MAQQKLYTEEQVKTMLNKARIFDGYVGENFVYILSDTDIISAEAPIELPSDEEIEEGLFHQSNEYAYGYKDAFKLMKEKILNK